MFDFLNNSGGKLSGPADNVFLSRLMEDNTSDSSMVTLSKILLNLTFMHWGDSPLSEIPTVEKYELKALALDSLG